MKILKESLYIDNDELNLDCLDELKDEIINIKPAYIRLENDEEWNTKQYTSFKFLVGCFACSAVTLSPYSYPDNLEKVINQVYLVFKKFTDKLGLLYISLNEINELLHKEILVLQEVQKWNERKDGVLQDISFISRYDAGKEIDPDTDFIDLDALAHYVCLLVRTDRREHDKFNKQFEENYKNGLL